jgi:hypothetical protein
LPKRFAEIRVPVLGGGLKPSRFGHFNISRTCVSEHYVPRD